MSEVAQETTTTTEQVSAEKSDADVIFANEQEQNNSEAENKQVENKAEAEGEQLQEQDSKPSEEKSEEGEFKLELIEGLTEEDLKEVVEFAKENNISQQAAQKILDIKLSEKQKFEDGTKKNLANAIEQWKDAAKNDPEIGGEKFDRAIKLAELTVAHYDKEFNDLLAKTGLGSHPLLLRFLYRVGLDLENDKLVSNPKNAAPENRQDYEYFY